MWTEADFDYETRWTRHYSKKPERRLHYIQSRFMDGSTTITLAELERDWAKWSDREKMDFAHSFATWGRVPDREAILRFLVGNGDHRTCWWAIAQSVARELPVDESVPIIRRWCESCEVGQGANYYQAISLTGDSGAHEILKSCFRRIWSTPGLMDDAEFINPIASDAISCIKHTLELNEDAEPYRSAYATLAEHPCEQVRAQENRWLSGYFA